MNENTKIFEWLVIFFLHEIPQDSDFTDKIFDKEIKPTGITKDNCFIRVCDIKDDKLKKFTTSVSRLEIIDEEKLEFDFIPLTYPNDINEFDFANGRSWEHLLRILFKKFKSKRKIIITCSHGGGFAIGDPPQNLVDNKIKLVNRRHLNIRTEEIEKTNDIESLFPEPALNRKKKNLPKEIPIAEIYQYKDYRQVQVGDQDFCKNLELLWVAELAEAIENTNEKVEILYMCNCSMQVFDSGWLLKKCVKYYVAAESKLSVFGYSYKRLLNEINSRPSISSKCLAKKIPQQFVKKYTIDFPEFESEVGQYTVFVNALRYYGLLKFCFNIIVFFIHKRQEVIINQIKDLRETKFQDVSNYLDPNGIPTLDDPANYGLIDLTYFLEEVAKLFNKNLIIHICFSLYKKFINKLVVSKYVGNDYKLNDLFREKKFFHSGISIYFPIIIIPNMQRNSRECAYFFDQEFDPFTQNTKWDEFLRFYLDFLL